MPSSVARSRLDSFDRKVAVISGHSHQAHHVFLGEDHRTLVSVIFPLNPPVDLLCAFLPSFSAQSRTAVVAVVREWRSKDSLLALVSPRSAHVGIARSRAVAATAEPRNDQRSAAQTAADGSPPSVSRSLTPTPAPLRCSASLRVCVCCAADGAEKKLALLTAKCAELEAAVASIDAARSNNNGAGAAASSSSAAAASSSSAAPLALAPASQASLLVSLSSLRALLVTEAAEREALQRENLALQTQVGKLKYRCDHLVNMLNEEEAVVAKLKAGGK